MADTSVDQPNQALGVGAIIGDSISILFGNFIAVMTMALLPTVVGLLISAVFVGWNVALGMSTPGFTDAGGVISFVLSILIDLVVYAISTGLLVQLAYDAKLGRPLQIGKYISRALSAALPIAVLSLVAGIVVGIALIAFIVPGLWAYALFSLMPAAVVIEKAGFNGLERSVDLTKQYRWPIVGALVVVIICALLINVVGGFIMAFAGGAMVINAVILALMTAFTSGLGGIAIALIYARLREIKEGISVDQISAVFE